MAPTDFTIDFQGSYIRVMHSEHFAITPETVKELWTVIGEACKKYNCKRVFAESPGPPKRSMGIVEAYRSAEAAMEACYGLTVAILHPGYQQDETTDFFKLAAKNRGVRIEFFSDRQEAFQWLGLNPPETN